MGTLTLPKARKMPRALQTKIEAADRPSSGFVGDADYWFRLIDERAAAAFLGVAVRTMQGLRQRGGGPRFVSLSRRCCRYRRYDLRIWAEERLCDSTTDSRSRTRAVIGDGAGEAAARDAAEIGNRDRVLQTRMVEPENPPRHEGELPVTNTSAALAWRRP